jgi:predicted transcriptional regulator
MPKFWHNLVDGLERACQFFGMSADFSDLSRRERQVLTALYRLKKASAAEIRSALTDPPTYTAIRTHLTLLEDKGHVRHETDGVRYVYLPVVPREEMGRRVIEGALKNFFDDSFEKVVTAFVKSEEVRFSEEELERLERLTRQARKEGR